MQGLSAEGRYVLMDGLRGLALFGILLVNLRLMAAPSMAFGEFSLWTGAWSEGALLLSTFFLDGAFWTLFALLFGAGFAFMMGETPPPLTTERGQVGLVTRTITLSAYYRRLFLIGCFGLLHVLLLWYGDILIIYTMAGAALPLFLRRRTSTLLIWAVLLTAVPSGLLLLTVSGTSLLGPEELVEIVDSYREDTQYWVSSLIESYRSADFSVLLGARVDEYNYGLWSMFMLVPEALSVMLIGLLLGRQGRFQLGAGQGSFFRKLFVWALLPAVLGKLAYAHAFNYGFASSEELFNLKPYLGVVVGGSVGGLASAFVLLCLLRVWYRSTVARWLQASLVAAGRMALTLYLMQSLIAGFIFYGYGLGLYGQVPPYALWVMGVAIFAGQLVFARVWFARFKKGPLEFVLRWFTYLGKS